MTSAVGLTAGVSQEEFKGFVAAYEARIIPLWKESVLASYTASVTGNDADYQKSNELNLEMARYYSDPELYAQLKAFRDGGQVSDPILKRELDLLYLQFQGYQIDSALIDRITTLATTVEQKFSTFRTKLGDREVADNVVDSILRQSTDSAELESVWLASKEIGRVVAPDVLTLTKLRNEAARSLGYKDYFEMQLKLSEIEPADLQALFDELDVLTRPVFVALKAEMDSILAARLGITPDQLRPWHYQNRFFQEAPSIYGVDLNSFYEGKDPVAIARKYFNGIGLEIDTILARSDLYEKPGKYQHAYSADVDRAGDARIICNLRPNYYWMATLLHELGHATYSRYNDPNLPWLLRSEPHAFTTEAVAEFFGALPANPRWLVEVMGVAPEEAARVAPACKRSFRAERLIFSRWAQVVVRFEQGLYGNPDQDLNKLWWDLVEKYQLLKRPEGRNEPDWAAKIHIASYPVYYYSYQMGQILAAQFADAIGRNVLGAENSYDLSFANDPRIGEFFREKVFRPGSRYPWNEMIEKATGRKLTSEYYAKQFVE
ncbi:MAG TPA: M2 family metallopeptidase [bacterium]|nr:M2 family metallopeptidase [bacterium]